MNTAQKLGCRRFVDTLTRKTPAATLFEPYMSDYIAEMLIWRRSPSLWDTPRAYISTQLSLRRRTQADIITLDTARFGESERAQLISLLNDQSSPDNPFTGEDGDIRAVAICRDIVTARSAERADRVCALALYRDVFDRDADYIPHKPFILMDGSPTDAIYLCADGYYAKSDAEGYLERYSDTLCILGGLGESDISRSNPRDISQRVQRLYTRCGYYALGTGRSAYGEYVDNNDEYLSTISLLGAYIKCRRL